MSRSSNEIQEAYSTLTRHPEGSLREMMTISFPLMLAILSGNLMMFFDRLILAQYSLEAMNAAAASSMAVMVLIAGTLGVSSIAEVFVGRANGAGEKTKSFVSGQMDPRTM